MDTSDTTFFTVLMPGSEFRQKVALSQNFVRRFRTKLPENVVLKVNPTGKTMSVGLTRTEDDIFFEHGWAQFVVEHFLEENDLLIFTFNESSSCFEVLLFNKTGCGKKIVAPTKDSDNSRSTHWLHVNEVTENEDCADDVLSVTESSSRTSSSDGSWYSNDSSSSLVKGRKRGTKANTKNANQQQTSTFRGKTQSSRSKGKSAAGTSRKSQLRLSFQSERRPVTAEEKVMAFERAQAVESSRPHFILVMQASHVYRYFNPKLPMEFVKQKFFQVPVTVLLQVTGSSTTWEVSAVRERQRGQVRLGRGWSNFVMDNNLEEADVCLFKLNFDSNRKDNPMFDITIFRVVDKIVSLKKVWLEVNR